MATTTNSLLPEKTSASWPARILSLAAIFWLAVATTGQWLFGFYILLFYGKATLTGDFEGWNHVLPHGYVEGDWRGNLLVGMHLLPAAILVMGGPLQLIPQVRESFPRFHRWSGRIYLTTAILVSTAGSAMVWTRGAAGDLIQHLSISIQALYIIFFAFLSIKYAIARQPAKHRIWTLRLFMVVNGVWFFRVGLMFWLLIHQAPVGFNPGTFTGPFLTALAVFTYAIPLSLIVLEMYLYARQSRNKAFSLLTSALIIAGTIIMGIGITGAAFGLWLPRM